MDRKETGVEFISLDDGLDCVLFADPLSAEQYDRIPGMRGVDGIIPPSCGVMVLGKYGVGFSQADIRRSTKTETFGEYQDRTREFLVKIASLPGDESIREIGW